MENEENQEQVFRRFPPPLEIAAAIPTFPQPRGERMEKWKSKSRIPTFPRHENIEAPENKKGGTRLDAG